MMQESQTIYFFLFWKNRGKVRIVHVWAENTAPLWFHEKSVNLGGIEHLPFRCGTTVTGIGLENIMKTGPK